MSFDSDYEMKLKEERIKELEQKLQVAREALKKFAERGDMFAEYALKKIGGEG